jgi:hypothetical protein
MRNRTLSLWLGIPISAVLAAGCSEQTQGTQEAGPKPPPVYAGGATTPPKTVDGKAVKNPKIINMTPNAKLVQ